MKINKKKVMVSALAVAMGAALVGSISGTIAWYQYSTRVTTAMVGTSAGVSRNLQIRIKDSESLYTEGNGWRSEITTAEVTEYFEKLQAKYSTATKDHSTNLRMKPITTGEIKADAAISKFYGNPVYQKAAETDWIAAEEEDYVDITFQIRALKGDSTHSDANPGGDALEAAKIYLTDLTIAHKNNDDGKKDLSKAIRVSLTDGTHNYLFSREGGNTVTSSKLDVNNDGKYDTVYVNGDTEVTYDFQAAEGDDGIKEVVYGASTTAGNSGNQSSYSATEKKVTLNKGVVADADADKNLFTTTTTATPLEVRMRIWIEGWQKLVPVAGNVETSTGSIWDTKDYIGSQFNVGISFASSAAERA